MIWLLLLLLLGPIDAIDLKLEQRELRRESRFYLCIGGPGTTATEFCRVEFDWDNDGDVDMRDWQPMTARRAHLELENEMDDDGTLD